MSELSICDHFHWTLEYLRSISLSDYLGIIKYLKKVERDHKKASRKSKK